MQLTKGQEQAVKVCVERYRNKEPYTVIAGVAGVGKSTAVQYIVEALNIPAEEVAYATFTGKASLVLRNKGCNEAMTLHKLLYIPQKIPHSDDIEFIPRTTLEKWYKLIVVDEASMISKEIFDLLLSHKIHIIFLGDHFQLPAVGENANILANPHVVLTEITRQALDSPIIRLSMDLREGKPLVYGGAKEARIIPRSKVSEKLLLGADIILCGKNATRHSLNEQVRKLKWKDKFQEGPVDGDKVMCLQNYWRVADSSGETCLVNGMIGTISQLRLSNTKLLKPKLTAKFVNEDGAVFNKMSMNIDYKMLTKHVPTVNSDNWRDFYKVQKPLLFDYADCITVHKSQGSQWDKVLVFAEMMGDRENYFKWCYTAVTRSVDRCILVV